MMGTFKTQMLWDCIRKGDLTATIGLLQSSNINLEERDENGQTFLMLACEFGELNIVRELLEANVDVNAFNKDSWSALLYSAKEGHLEIVIELLEREAKIEHRDLDGWTALMWASYKGRDLVVQELLERGANPNVKTEDGWTALMWASYKGRDLVVQELLERGANPNVKAEMSMTSLAWAAGRGHFRVVELLIQKGAKVNTSDKYGTTPLIWASRKGYLEIVEALLNEGASVDSVGMNSWTALLVATKGDYSEVVHQILEYNPNVNAVDKDRFTALTIAAKEGNLAIVHDLLGKGAHVNIADRAGDTTLIHAVKGGHTDVVMALINKYADVDVEGADGKTALYWAVEKGHVEIVRIILSNGPDLEISTKDGDTALLRAVRNKYEQSVRLLLDRGAKVSAVDKKGNTALHISLKARSKRITELLLRNPKNSSLLYRPNKSGETPYNMDKSQILAQIFHHRNLNTSDGENLLGYDIYSSALADILSEPSLNTPITIGLYAKWGSGKSFLLSKLQKCHQFMIFKMRKLKCRMKGMTKELDIIKKERDTLKCLVTSHDELEKELDLLKKENKKLKEGNESLSRQLIEAKEKKLTEEKTREKEPTSIISPTQTETMPFSLGAPLYHSTPVKEKDQEPPKEHVLLVEYNKGAVYFGRKQQDRIEYCRAPLGKITNNVFKKIERRNSFCLDPKDTQIYNDKYLIKTFEARILEEMKSFTVANEDKHFTFCVTLFVILLFFNNILGLALALSGRWKEGLGVGFGLFPVEYIFLGVVYVLANKYNIQLAVRVSLLLGRKLMVLTLLLKVLFCNPKHKSKNYKYTEPAVRFLFSESTKLTSVGGEKALAAMIGTLGDSLEREYGTMVARLFRVFKPHADKPYTGRFKSLCCIPYFIIVYLVIVALEVGIYLFLSYRLYEPIPETNVQADTSDYANTTTVSSSDTGMVGKKEDYTTVYAILITIACVFVLALLSNIYTWGQALLALLKSQKNRIMQSADQIDKIKMDGLMQKLKFEVNLMARLVTCMDQFTRNQTRLVVIVDGLDSCEQDKVLQVLDIIKALFSDEDSPFITILAIDPQVIIKGIDSNIVKTRLTFQDTNVNGFDYLRNVVHLPFYLQSQGMAVKKQEMAPSNSAASNEASRHSGSESPSKTHRNFQHQESTMSISSVYEPKRKHRCSRENSVAQSYQSTFDLTNGIMRTDYFSDINPRSVKRLMNIVAVTGRILRAYNIDFSWHRLASWINLIEQWPYRVSWIIFYFEEHEMLDNNLSLYSIYEKIESKIPVSKDVEPLLEIDRNVRKLEASLASKVTNNIMLNVADLKKFLPCTINLDPYLRKLIRELEKNNDIMARTDFPIGPLYPGGPPPGAPGTSTSGKVITDNGFLPRRFVSPRGRMSPYPQVTPYPGDQGISYPPMMPYPMMMSPYPMGYPPAWVYQHQSQKDTDEKILDPNTLIQDYQGEVLGELDIDQICQLLPRLKGINQSQVGEYQSRIRDNNISGLVLTNCDLEELNKVMDMRFGDWQLFKSTIKALRCWVEEGSSSEQAKFARDFRPLSRDGVDGEGVVEERVRHPSFSESVKEDEGGQRSKHQPLCRQTSVESTKGGYLQTERGKFATIAEEKEQEKDVVTETKPKMTRKDSTLQQVEYESSLLREAMMMSFAEEDEDDDDGVNTSEELLIREPKEEKEKSSRPVKFSLGNTRSNDPEEEENFSPLSDTSPLLTESAKSGSKSLSPTHEKLSWSKISTASSIRSLPGSKSAESKAHHSSDTAAYKRWKESRESGGFHGTEEKDAVVFIDEVKPWLSTPDLSQNAKSPSEGEGHNQASSSRSEAVARPLSGGYDVWPPQSHSSNQQGLQMVTYSNDRDTDEFEAQV